LRQTPPNSASNKAPNNTANAAAIAVANANIAVSNAANAPSAAANMPTTRRRFLFQATALIAAVASGASVGAGLTGCGYQLGAQAALPFSTISIEPIQNETLAPQIQVALHEQIAATLARENNLTLVADGAQATLRVRIHRYNQYTTATNPRDTAIGMSFNLTLVVQCDLLNNRDPSAPYFKGREITASAVAHSPEAIGASGGFSAVEYQTLPSITRDLARKIRDSITSTW
jgi:outer membrane lipopolysaccharide assembly protein LptE/RlpB